MFKSISIISSEPCKVFDHKQVCAVEQFRSQDFNINDFGWPQNDLSALVAATSMKQAEAILRRLVDVGNDSKNLPDGITIRDAYDLIRPRYAQSESEVLAFADAVASKGLELDAAYRKALHLEEGVTLPAEGNQVEETLETAS